MTAKHSRGSKQEEERIDFAILAIREDEFRAIFRRFSDWSLRKGERDYNISKTGHYTIALVRCGEQGNAEAQAVTRDVISDLDPRCIVVAGIAGAVPDTDFTLGDVIVSTRITEYNVGAELPNTTDFAVGGGAIEESLRRSIANLQARKELDNWNSDDLIGLKRPSISFTDDMLNGSKQWKAKISRSLAFHTRLKDAGDNLSLLAVQSHQVTNSSRLPQY